MDPGILKSRFARNRTWKNWEVYFIFCRPFVKDKPFLPVPIQSRVALSKPCWGPGVRAARAGSTGRDFRFPRRNQRVSAKRGGRPAPRFFPWKNHRLV